MRWRRAFKVLMWLLSLGLVVPLATVECVYQAMLARVPSLPQKVEGPSPPASWNQVRWAQSEHTSALRVQPVWPTTLLYTLMKVTLSRPAAGGMRGTMPHGFRLAGSVAHTWSRIQEGAGASRIRVFETLALTIWLTRNWTAEELLAFEARHLWFGRDLIGAHAAAPVLLRKEWVRLDATDAALLLAVAENPRGVGCAPDRLRQRRDRLLGHLSDAGVVSAAEAEAARTSPPALSSPAREPSCPRR